MWRVGLIGLVACASQTPAGPPTETFDINVVVDQLGVRIYAVGLDRAPCVPEDDDFPVPGTCAPWADYDTCIQSESCTDKRVSIDGSPSHPFDYRIGETVWLQRPAEPDFTVVIDGCGGVARIPISVGELSMPSATSVLDSANQLIQVDWSATPAATSALLMFGDDVSGSTCHVTSPSYQFTSPFASWYSRFAIWSLDSPTEVDTELGVAHVWRGAYASTVITHP